MAHRQTPPDRPGSILTTASDWHYNYHEGAFDWDCHLCREALADELENKVIAKAFRYRAPGL